MKFPKIGLFEHARARETSFVETSDLVVGFPFGEVRHFIWFMNDNLEVFFKFY